MKQKLLPTNADSLTSVEYDENASYFCYLFIKQYQQAWIGFAMIGLALYLLFKAVAQYRRIRGISNRIIRLIFAVIFFWAATYVVKFTMAQAMYWSQRWGQESDSTSYHYSIASKYLYVIDICAAFLLQTVLILVIYNWIGNLVEIFKPENLSYQWSSIESVDKKEGNFTKFEQRVLRLIKVYLILRNLSLGWIIPFIFMKNQEDEDVIVKIVMILVVVETFIVLVIVMLGLRSLTCNQRIIDLIQDKERKRMQHNYISLISCIAARIILGCVFVYFNFQRLSSSECVIDTVSAELRWLSIAVIPLEAFLAHYLPIFITLKIYRVEEGESVDLSDSFIKASINTR